MSRASDAMTSSAVDATINIDAVGRDLEIPHLGSHQRDCTCRPGVDELGRRLACHAGAIVRGIGTRTHNATSISAKPGQCCAAVWISRV
jgi:hypothetical protein